jgi:hypothetical protein
MTTRIPWPGPVLVFLITFLLAACAGGTRKDLPQVTPEGLHLKQGTVSDAVYVLPEADFGEFNQVAILEVSVAFRKNWLRDQNRERRALAQRITQEDADQIRSALGEEFSRVFTEELGKGGYNVVQYESADRSAADLLLLRPAIINLDIAAPDVMAPGMTRTYTSSAGSMTLLMEAHDAHTGALLARVVDSRSAPDIGRMQISNRVTNVAEADRIFRKWSRLLVSKLDAAHGR